MASREDNGFEEPTTTKKLTTVETTPVSETTTTSKTTVAGTTATTKNIVKEKSPEPVEVTSVRPAREIGEEEKDIVTVDSSVEGSGQSEEVEEEHEEHHVKKQLTEPPEDFNATSTLSPSKELISEELIL